MLDFLMISTRSPKKGVIEIYPKFTAGNDSEDLMIRGRDFYAIWNSKTNLWSTKENVAFSLIDEELDAYAEDHKNDYPDQFVKVLHMWDTDNGMIDKWHKYVQKQLRDSYHSLDEKIIFSNVETTKEDYASRKLTYPMEKCETPAYDEMMSVLYSPEERHKIEWAIGAIISGDSKEIQKFVVLYGSGGTGKSTVLNIIMDLFQGYFSVFDSRALGSSNNSFALEAFRSNPLVSIQHDGDLSKIEDNTKLNSLVSHETMVVNEKFKATYAARFNAFIFMGTNKPVKITDAKSGIIRRLIDVSPTGNLIPRKRYDELKRLIKFELGGIAAHCLEVYEDDPGAYDSYIPTAMLGASNDFYNFIIFPDTYELFEREDSTTLKAAYEMYKKYCEYAKVIYTYSYSAFREELKNYFKDFKERATTEDGERIRNYYSGFIIDKFENQIVEKKHLSDQVMIFDSTTSVFDVLAGSYPAQYANEQGTPLKKWADVTTKLSDLNTNELHFVQVPTNHIVIDFDIKDENGNKSFELNSKAASKWPSTYAELSKSGAGIHLHYLYSGDVTKLSRLYDKDIEIKVFTGNSSLRRKLSKCNTLPIATISSGLPLKEEKDMISFEGLKNEKALRTAIKRNLNKEIWPNTKPSIDLIFKCLEDAYNSGMNYGVDDLRPAVLAFAAQSSHQADYCIKLVNRMHFHSEEQSEPSEPEEPDTIIFFDVEVYSNLFIVCWKAAGKRTIRMINPTPMDIESILKFKLIGFNNRRYDNHILYARLIGYSNEQLFELSKRIINQSANCFFSEAYNLSYTDIYDFSSKKQSLKKWEIELGIHHQEMDIPWDQPVPEELWNKVADYCVNDVEATEAVFNHLKADFTARQILADFANGTVNDTTNSLSTKFIFEGNRNPQSEFNYRDMSLPVGSDRYEEYKRLFGEDYIFRVFNARGTPEYRDYIPGEKLPDGWSILPFFPKYRFEEGKSYWIKDEDDIGIPIACLEKEDYEIIGEGGRVYSEPGMYINVLADDVASQHPHSAISECLFGPYYTKRFKEIVDARVAIKHKDFDSAKKMLNGAITKYLNDESLAKDVSNALKIVINSVYGLTSASFDNAFRDRRNVDNIVAKRGALVMTLLKEQVQALGYKVCHIKTDCIKIPNYTDDIHNFIVRFGKEYGYDFEIEAVYEKFCLVNDAVYIAKERDGDWNATGTQFAVPFVFKTLFSHEPVVFDDMCETKAVQSALYLDMNEGLEEGEHNYRFVGKVGRFCPMISGAGGGILLREDAKIPGKYNSATGAKGYRWMESEMVKTLQKENLIDISYYRNLVDEAIKEISKYGDFELFANGDMNPPWE